MSLSLVIPFFNEGKNVEDVIMDIINEFNEKNINYSLIAVNNGSSDNICDILEELSSRYSQIKIVNINKNIGYGYGVTQGLKVATGDYVGYSVGDGQISGADVARVFDEAKRGNTSRPQKKSGGF